MFPRLLLLFHTWVHLLWSVLTCICSSLSLFPTKIMVSFWPKPTAMFNKAVRGFTATTAADTTLPLNHRLNLLPSGWRYTALRKDPPLSSESLLPWVIGCRRGEVICCVVSLCSTVVYFDCCLLLTLSVKCVICLSEADYCAVEMIFPTGAIKSERNCGWKYAIKTDWWCNSWACTDTEKALDVTAKHLYK